jgi:hypothetical protein
MLTSKKTWTISNDKGEKNDLYQSEISDRSTWKVLLTIENNFEERANTTPKKLWTLAKILQHTKLSPLSLSLSSLSLSHLSLSLSLLHMYLHTFPIFYLQRVYAQVLAATRPLSFCDVGSSDVGYSDVESWDTVTSAVTELMYVGISGYILCKALRPVFVSPLGINLTPEGEVGPWCKLCPLGVKLSLRGEDPVFAPSFFWREEFVDPHNFPRPWNRFSPNISRDQCYDNNFRRKKIDQC